MDLLKNEENYYLVTESIEQLPEFEEWVHNGLDKVKEMIKDTAEK